jgi:predicted RNA binding protein YcfA (HicA-like mRNA interferase family)
MIMRRLRRKDAWLARRVLSGRADANIPFEDLRGLLSRLGFTERVRGSHHIFVRDGVAELVSFQRAGAQTKPYQVWQVRGILRRYELLGGE